MIYFTPQDHAVACLLFACLGAVSGMLYKSINTFFDILSRFLLLFVAAVKSNSPFTDKSFKIKKQNNKSRNILDFLFFLTLGVSYILFSYVTLAAQIRLYCILIFITSFVIFETRMSIPVDYALRFIFERIYTVAFFFSYFILLPARVVFKQIIKLVNPYTAAIRYSLLKRAFNKAVKRECADINKIFSA